MLAVSWVGVSLFNSQKETQLESKYLKMAKPLVPKLDDIALARIKNKEEILDSELEDFPIYILEQSERNLFELVKITASGVSRTAPIKEGQEQDKTRLKSIQDVEIRNIEIVKTSPPTTSTSSAVTNQQATPSAVQN